MNLNKIIKYILIAIPLLFLAKWGIYSLSYTPDINPQPIQKVRIHGKFPFDKNITMSHFTITYRADNSQCNKQYRTFGIFVAKESPRIYNINIPVIKHKNEYEAYYYLDYLLPGNCKWTFDSFMDNIEVKNDTEILSSKRRGYSQYVGYNNRDAKKHYIFSNTLTYNCFVVKYIHKNLKSDSDLWCFNNPDNDTSNFTPYENAKDITQNYIYTKEKTIWTK